MAKTGAFDVQTIQKKLAERIGNLRDPVSQFRSAGCHLVYEVNDNEIVVYVITVGKQDRGLMYVKTEKRKKT